MDALQERHASQGLRAALAKLVSDDILYVHSSGTKCTVLKPICLNSIWAHENIIFFPDTTVRIHGKIALVTGKADFCIRDENLSHPRLARMGERFAGLADDRSLLMNRYRSRVGAQLGRRPRMFRSSEFDSGEFQKVCCNHVGSIARLLQSRLERPTGTGTAEFSAPLAAALVDNVGYRCRARFPRLEIPWHFDQEGGIRPSWFLPHPGERWLAKMLGLLSEP